MRVTVTGTALPPKDAVEVVDENEKETFASGLTTVAVNTAGDPVLAPDAARLTEQLPLAGAVTVTEAGDGVDDPAAKETVDALRVQVPLKVAVAAPDVPPPRETVREVVPLGATDAPELVNASVPGEVAPLHVKVKSPEDVPDTAE